MAQPDFSELCQQTAVWERLVSRDQFGEPTYAAPVTFSPADDEGARRETKTVRKLNSIPEAGAPGADVQFISGSVIYILATPAIQLGDRVYILGDTAPYPPIISVDQPVDETGQPHHTEVTLGSAKG